MVSTDIEKCSEDLDHKLLRWQQQILQNLSNGICPSKENIYCMLGVSSIFYVQWKDEQSYTDFLTPNNAVSCWRQWYEGMMGI
jgi:hypothetical protein